MGFDEQDSDADDVVVITEEPFYARLGTEASPFAKRKMGSPGKFLLPRRWASFRKPSLPEVTLKPNSIWCRPRFMSAG